MIYKVIEFERILLCVNELCAWQMPLSHEETVKLLTVVGARPQFVKAAVVSRALKNRPSFHELIVHTGQHFDHNMSEVFFSEMKIPRPTFQLDIHGQSHGAMTGRMLEGIEEILLREKPDAVLVYGDTNSTLAGALAAAKLHIPVAHVEAGLRSFNKNMPEEINRILTDQVSEWLFCPTKTAVKHATSEGLNQDQIHEVGDVMYDAVLYYQKKNRPSETLQKLLQQMDAFLLCTIHRAENTDNSARLTEIFSALRQIAEQIPIVLPVHPRTKKLLKTQGLSTSGLQLIDPVGYFDMLVLLERAQGVLTDSGGLQKEAYFFSKPCLTLRDETEWTETVDAGVNILVGAERSKILTGFERIQSGKLEFGQKLYGNGHAAEKILDILEKGR